MTEIKFRDRWTGRKTTGYVKRELPDGRLIVRTMHRAARGGTWAATDTIVKPSQVIE